MDYTSYLNTDTHILTIFEGDKVLATVSDVQNEEDIDDIVRNVVFDLRGIILL